MTPITTNGITILLVEVPEDASDFRIDYASIIVLSWATTNENGSIELSSGKWVILGKSIELSEEQMNEICEEEYFQGYFQGFCNYMSKQVTPLTVQESYLSLLEANGIVDRNPYGDKPKRYIAFFHRGFMTDNDFERLEEYDIQLSKYQEAQSKVKHYLVLKPIK